MKLKPKLTEIFDKSINELQKKYKILNLKEVKKYLLNNQDLIPILLDSPKLINEILPNALLEIELHIDPEERWERLFIIIRANGISDNFTQVVKKLFFGWFKNYPKEVKNRLSFSLTSS
jgi:hypothetical protein